jgi:hypothetical protein
MVPPIIPRLLPGAEHGVECGDNLARAPEPDAGKPLCYGDQRRLEFSRDCKVATTIATKQNRKMSPGELIMAPERREATLFALLKRDAAIWRGRQYRNAGFAPENIITARPPQGHDARAKRIPSWTAERRRAVGERTGGIRGRPPDPGKYFEADAPCGMCGYRLRYIRNKSCVECARVWNARAADKLRRLIC